MATKSSLLLTLAVLLFLCHNVISVPLPEIADNTEKKSDSIEIRSEQVKLDQPKPMNAQIMNANSTSDPQKDTSPTSPPVTNESERNQLQSGVTTTMATAFQGTSQPKPPAMPGRKMVW